MVVLNAVIDDADAHPLTGVVVPHLGDIDVLYDGENAGIVLMPLATE